MSDAKTVMAQTRPTELLRSDATINEVAFQDNVLRETQSKQVVGKAVRVIRDGRIGTVRGGITHDAAGLIADAESLSRFGRNAVFSLPATPPGMTEDTFIEGRGGEFDLETLVKTGQECVDLLAARLPDWSVNVNLGNAINACRLMNHSGIDWTLRTISADISVMLTCARDGDILEIFDGRMGIPDTDAMTHLAGEMADIAEKAMHSVTVKPGRYPLLIDPRTLPAFLAPFEMAIHGRNVFESLSPLVKRMDERIFHESITLVDDPLDRRLSGYRPVCDEGTPRTPLTIVENGHLRHFITDLEYAGRTGFPHTGHGSRFPDAGSSDVPRAEPHIDLSNIDMAAGDLSAKGMREDMKTGIYLMGTYDTWSGNLLNGDISGSTHLAFLVRDGEIAGRVKDMRFSGNIYEMLGKNLGGLSRERPETYVSNLRAPFVLVNDVVFA